MPQANNAKTHVLWAGLVVVAFLAGRQFAEKEILVVEKPVEVVRTREVIVEKPVVVSPPASPAAAPDSAVASAAAKRRTRSRSQSETERLHERYDPFLTQLGLTQEQKDRFVALKIATYEAQRDLQAAVEQNGVPGGSAGVAELRRKVTQPMWDEIRALLGPQGMAAYGDYEMMSAVRPSVVNVFADAGGDISEPHADQVARLAMKHMKSYRARPTDISSNMKVDWAAVARDAETFLNPEQLQALKAEAARNPVP